MSTLPLPASGRFRPLRAGLVDLFLYEAQEFRFRDGRLLLRGDNGSGKSKVMALTLPLLLDANLTPARMEPDADPKKQMAWNLLQDGAYPERTGYSWVEFGRLDEDGRTHVITLGLGVKAVEHKGVVKQWWFVTDRRVGEDLHLVDRVRTPLTRERLIDAIGDRGTVFDTAERYRRAVDEALFSLHDRYDALVDLLVHLRQPQLSKRPDERALAHALSESLPPVAAQLVAVVAESYQALDDDEREVARLRSGSRSVAAFAEEYRRYARVATARAALGPRQAQSEYERDNRHVAEASATLEEARRVSGRADASTRERSLAVAELNSRLEALRERLRSDDLQELESARRIAQEHKRSARSADAAASRAADAADAARRDAAVAEQESHDARRRLAHADKELRRQAAPAGVPLPPPDPSADAEALSAAISAEAVRRRRQVDDLDERAARLAETGRERVAAQRRLDDRTVAHERAAADASAAGEEAAAIGATWANAVRAHLLAAVELGIDGVDDVLHEAERWAVHPDGENPAARWVRDAGARARDRLIDYRVRAEGAASALAEPIRTLNEEIEGLTAGRILRPPAPRTRTSDRSAPGAPLWMCVDVPPGSTEVGAGIEAALEASGLLDAWVTPGGALTDSDGDVLLEPAPVAGPTLATALVPTPPDDSGLDRAVIAAVLGSIGLRAHPRAGEVAVASDGRFALGPLVGAHTKSDTDYLGATARDRARRTRLDRAQAERLGLIRDRDGFLAKAGSATARLAALAGEVRALPDDRRLTAAVARVAALADAVERAADAMDVARAGLERAVEAERSARSSVEEAASLYELDPAATAAVRDALVALAYALDALVEAHDGVRRASANAERRSAAAAEADDSRAITETDAGEVRRLASRAAERLRVLESTVGVEARELQRQLDEADRSRADAVTALEDARRVQTESGKRMAVLEDRLETAEQKAAQAAEARVEATRRFARFATTGFPALVAPQVELPTSEATWLPDPTVRAARAIATELDQPVDDDQWDRAGSRLLGAFETLQSALSSQGTEAAREQRAGAVVVEIRQGVRTVDPVLLAEELADALATRQRLLTERERAVLQTHLIDEVGAELQGRVQDAVLQVDRMNRELAKRRTRSGLELRLRWEPVDDEAGAGGRRILQQSAAAWTPADREDVGAFLQNRIEQQREADPDGDWHERLARAFDYRQWNRFQVQRRQDDRWRPAAGPGSGGERVLAASVPLFAAAASHYASAGNPHAPRLILLDEAFAGVDDRSRATYLGLLAEFDLDVMMTSEREWATYPEVPGIAIAQLFRLPGLSAVHVEHWEWDGAERRQVDDPGTTAIAAAEPVHDSVERADDAVALDFDDVPG